MEKILEVVGVVRAPKVSVVEIERDATDLSYWQ
jgi:hypothetical protein